MNKEYGDKDCPKVQCTNIYIDIYVVRWDYNTEIERFEDGSERETTSFYEYRFTHKPTIDEIRDIIFSQINDEVKEKIESGYVWRGNKVWLSRENQFNYKAAHDNAVMTEGKSLPVTFKFGDVTSPTYYTFTEIVDIEDFYNGAINHIKTALEECWRQKDSIDWSEYEALLR